ncbi:replication protein C, IncQ-type, partial [Vibrio parahaemolyticus]|nr:replication protein C, IncQ-type [Vibrio parahaemolyticus]
LEALEIDLKGGSINEKETFRLLELPALKISLTRYELLKELQRSTSGAKNYKWLEASLDRLGAVSFKYDGARWSGSFNLLSYRFNKDTEQYDVFIIPTTAHSVWSQKANYIFIHRQERHLLKADASRVLHSYLSGVVRLGETRHIGIDTVVSAVWAQYDEEVSSDTFRFRAKQISDGCKELSRLNGWSAEIVGRGKKAKVKVSRSK